MPIYIPQPDVTPSVAEQYYLCLINRDRADPAGAYDRFLAEATPGTEAALAYFGVSLSLLEDQLAAFPPVPPLAWNASLAISAERHSLLIVEYDEQSHNLPGEPGLFQRIVEAGYDDARALAENVYAYSDGPLHGHAAFLIDWGYGPGGMQSPAGHRIAILSPTYTEIGIGIVTDADSDTRVGTEIVTQHFGTTWSPEAQIVGVVIDDRDGDDFYDPGEGLGGVTVTASGGGETYVTTSWASGGYQMQLPPGTYVVTFSGGGLEGEITETVTIAASNVGLDVEADDAVLRPAALMGGGGADLLAGDARAEVIEGRGGNDSLSGGGGNDTIFGGTGFDEIHGGDGADWIEAAGGFDTVSGGAGDDTILGQAGADSLSGEAGDDVLKGGIGPDALMGGSGDDWLEAGDGADFLQGHDGSDTLSGQAGADTLDGGPGHDLLQGGINRDVLMGGAGNDRLEGGDGFDRLDGGEGNDTLLGQAGNDTLVGGDGDDLLHGGIGTDVFVFAPGGGQDVIVHYQPGIDVIHLEASLAPDGVAGLDAETVGNDLVIILADGGEITFDGIRTLTEIEADFVLI
jgi:Ca2+-binding RTX toxin-like protein